MRRTVRSTPIMTSSSRVSALASTGSLTLGHGGLHSVTLRKSRKVGRGVCFLLGDWTSSGAGNFRWMRRRRSVSLTAACDPSGLISTASLLISARPSSKNSRAPLSLMVSRASRVRGSGVSSSESRRLSQK